MRVGCPSFRARGTALENSPATLATITIHNRSEPAGASLASATAFPIPTITNRCGPRGSQFPPFVYPRASLARAHAFCALNPAPSSRAGARTGSEIPKTPPRPHSRARAYKLPKSQFRHTPSLRRVRFCKVRASQANGSDRQVLRGLSPIGGYLADPSPLCHGLLCPHPVPIPTVPCPLRCAASGSAAVYPASRLALHCWRLAFRPAPSLGTASEG